MIYCVKRYATIPRAKHSLIPPTSISPLHPTSSHILSPGIIGETAMHLDISLTNVNVGMPLSVQDKYLVEGRSLYLIMPLDVQVLYCAVVLAVVIAVASVGTSTITYDISTDIGTAILASIASVRAAVV
jgi:hypothetical protein